MRRVLRKATLLTFPETPQTFLAMAQRQVDAMAVAMPSGIRFVNESGGRFRFVEGALAWEPTALGVKKGEHRLLDAVNKALADFAHRPHRLLDVDRAGSAPDSQHLPFLLCGVSAGSAKRGLRTCPMTP